jgi:hypothetical protein
LKSDTVPDLATFPAPNPSAHKDVNAIDAMVTKLQYVASSQPALSETVQTPEKVVDTLPSDTRIFSLPVNSTLRNDSYPDVSSGSVFTVEHSDTAYILDTACTQRKLDFHNSNWPIGTHFYGTVGDDPDFLIKVQLIQCNHNVSFNNTVVSEIVFNYSKSKATRVTESKHILI